MSEPQKYTLKESNVRKFYGNIIQSGAFTAQDLGGTEDDFVNQIGGDPDKLVKVRNNMLVTGVVTEADLGGNESLFMQSFLKKNDDSLVSSKDSYTTPVKLSEDKPIETTEDVDQIDRSYQDYYSQTTWMPGGGAYHASFRKNQVLSNKANDEYTKQLSEKREKQLHDASNIIAEDRYNIDFSADEKTVRAQLDSLEDRLERETNPNKDKEVRSGIRMQLAEAFSEDLYDDLLVTFKAEGIDSYNALSNDEKAISDWKKKWRRKVPGELIDAAVGRLEAESDSIVLDNEYDNHVLPAIKRYESQGFTTEESDNLVYQERQARKKKHFEGNADKSEIKRAELWNEIQQLQMEDPEDARIPQLMAQMESHGPLKYNADGTTAIPSEVEQIRSRDEEIDADIEKITPQLTSFESAEVAYDEAYMVWENLHRAEMERSKAYSKEVSQTPIGGFGVTTHITSPQDKKDAVYSSQKLHQAEIRLMALERIVFMNDNPVYTKKGKNEGGKGYYKELFWDGVRDANQGRLGTKVTRSEIQKAAGEEFTALGQITEDEQAALAPDIKEELSHGAGGMADFLVKMAVADASIVGALKAPADAYKAARTIKTAYRVRKASSLGKEAKFILKATNKLENSIISAGLNEARFQAGGMEPGHGAAFHYAEAGLGRVVPLLLKRGNKYLASIANAMARSPMTMTLSMEAVAAGSGAVHALANDKLVVDELKNLFGDLDEVGRRVAVEMMLGAMFGVGEVAKASKSGMFEYSADYITRLQKKAIKKGRYDVAAELGNIKFQLFDADWAGTEARKIQKKIDYLVGDGVEAKELFLSKKMAKGKGNRADISKINEEFELRAAKDVNLYDKVLGEGSLESLRAKKKILKESGVDVDGHSPGNIEVLYERMKHDPEYGVKVLRKTERHEITTRRKTAKDISNKLKDENIGEGLSESTDADIAIRKSKQIERSEVEKEFMKSYRRTRRDTSKKRLDQWGEKYKRTVKGEWNGTEAKPLTEQMLSTVNDGLSLLESANIKGKHRDKLKAAKRVLESSLKNEKALTNEQADMLTKRITDSQNAFTVTAMRKSINDSITTPKKQSSDRLDPKGIDAKTSFLMKAIDGMFNRAKMEDVIRTGSESQVKSAEKRLDEFRMTENQAKEMLDAKERDPRLHEGEDLTLYEGVMDAIKSGTTHQKALNRRSELRKKAESETLSEREMIEYEVLGFADGQKMSMNQLAEANRALKSLIRHGRTEYKVEHEHQQLKERLQRYNVARTIDPRSADPRTKIIDQPQEALNAFQTIHKSIRGGTESLTTMMEWLSSRTPGRSTLEGELHAYTDKALKAGNDKAAEIGYFVKEMIDIESRIFEGGPKEAQKAFERWREVHDFEIIRDGVLTSERMSIQDAMTISAYAKQKDQASTFEYRGWEPETLLHLEKQISDLGGKEAITWRDAVVGELMPRIWSRVNSRYKIDVGTDLSIIENYFPVARKFDGETGLGDPFTLHNDPLANIRSTHTSSSKERNPDMASWYKVSPKGNKIAFNDMLYRHLEHSMHYVHYQPLIKDLNSVFRHEDVKGVIESGFGEATNKRINDIINDLGRGKSGADKVKWMDNLRARYIRSSLGLNILLLPKQLTSINGYQAELSATEALKWMPLMAKPDFEVMKMLARSRDIRLRYETNQWNRDLAIVESQMRGSAAKTEGPIKLARGEGIQQFSLKNLKDNMLIPTKYGDLGAIVWGGQAMYRVRYDTYIKKGFDAAEASQRAYNDFIRATRRTQQSGAIEDLSYVQKGSFMKTVTQFKNAPLQYMRNEHMAVTNMYQGWKQGDKAKFTNGLKNFVLYHFILPQAFHSASNGFYLGDDDKSWLDDPMTLVVALGGSLSNMPILGSYMVDAVQRIATGKGFGVDLGVAADIFGELQEFGTVVYDVLSRANEPGEFKIEADEILQFFDSGGKMIGAPVKTVSNYVKGWDEYLSGETDDELALLGYSPYMRGDYGRSRFHGVIHKHLPENGGSLSTMRREFAENNGEAATQKAWPRLEREYRMYDHFGSYDRHVNFIYNDLKPGYEQATYIYQLYKRRVEDKRPMRKNISIKEILDNVEQSDQEFKRWMVDLTAYGVIGESTLEEALIMIRDKYKEAYEY